MDAHRDYFSGLDLGQAQDYTALVVLQRQAGAAMEGQRRAPPHYAVRQLCRFPLGTAYTDVCTQLGRWFARPPLAGSILAVDETGVGRPVVDLLRRSKLQAQVRPVTITAGNQASAVAGGGARVPKKELVSTLQVLLQARRLQVASRLPHAATLVRELLNFQVKITAAQQETFAAGREGPHDDLVLALALAAWQAEHTKRLNLLA